MPPDQSGTAAEQAASASSGSRSRERAGDIGEPRAEQKRRDALSRIGERVQKMQEDAAVLAHRAGDIEQRDDRRRLRLRPDEAQIDEIAAAFHAGAQRAADVDQMAARMRREPPRAHFGKRQHEPLHRRPWRRRSRRWSSARNPSSAAPRGRTPSCGRRARSRAPFSACRRGRRTAPRARASRRPAAPAAPPAPAAASSPAADRHSRGGGKRCGTPDRTGSNARGASRTPHAASSKNPRGCRRRRPSPLQAHRAPRPGPTGMPAARSARAK